MKLFSWHNPDIVYNIQLSQREINSILMALNHICFATMEHNAKVSNLQSLDYVEWEELLKNIKKMAEN